MLQQMLNRLPGKFIYSIPYCSVTLLVGHVYVHLLTTHQQINSLVETVVRVTLATSRRNSMVQSSISFTVDSLNFCLAVGEQNRECLVVTTCHHLKYCYTILWRQCITRMIDPLLHLFFLLGVAHFVYLSKGPSLGIALK